MKSLKAPLRNVVTHAIYNKKGRMRTNQCTTTATIFTENSLSLSFFVRKLKRRGESWKSTQHRKAAMCVLCTGWGDHSDTYMQHHGSILRAAEKLVGLTGVEHHSVHWPPVFCEHILCTHTHTHNDTSVTYCAHAQTMTLLYHTPYKHHDSSVKYCAHTPWQFYNTYLTHHMTVL